MSRTDTVEANKLLAQRLYDNLFNRGHLALAQEWIGADCINHTAPGGLLRGPEGLRRRLRQLSAAFPDHRHVIEDLIAEGDKVVARLTFTGTQAGTLWGHVPTGRHCVQTEIHIMRVVDGQVMEFWALRDDVSLLQQMGLIPREPTEYP